VTCFVLNFDDATAIRSHCILCFLCSVFVQSHICVQTAVIHRLWATKPPLLRTHSPRYSDNTTCMRDAIISSSEISEHATADNESQSDVSVSYSGHLLSSVGPLWQTKYVF